MADMLTKPAMERNRRKPWSSYHSPYCTAFSTPTAAVLFQSKPCPTWSAWARVLSSKSISRGSLARGRYWRFLISFIDLWKNGKESKPSLPWVMEKMIKSCYATGIFLPSPLEGGLWHICSWNHLFTGSHPHDRAIVTLRPAVQLKVGQCPPRQSHLVMKIHP